MGERKRERERKVEKSSLNWRKISWHCFIWVYCHTLIFLYISFIFIIKALVFFFSLFSSFYNYFTLRLMCVSLIHLFTFIFFLFRLLVSLPPSLFLSHLLPLLELRDIDQTKWYFNWKNNQFLNIWFNNVWILFRLWHNIEFTSPYLTEIKIKIYADFIKRKITILRMRNVVRLRNFSRLQRSLFPLINIQCIIIIYYISSIVRMCQVTTELAENYSTFPQIKQSRR